ncbi:hypothetical protein PPERSA_00482 [Pseudocohnilembus persalinus]|uniref:G-protein coupled receptors family 2 profile 2 domain-containing protein n=1 Tax=Pseudocohnilembus persalinus TaxID=266149 RepID=A0A0V0QI50_PSEPJ|nr:hypothetical protein PPERSA_00482 [Pseudocohnilembus persalinus]|eukprot:KRX01860.1 hypothetical protein PPERSA_00482 [Pseudocohnilembus persalinus]
MTQQQDSDDNLQETEDKMVCKVQAFLINYGELSSILWTTVIAWVLYQKIVIQRIQNYNQYEMKMFFYAYLIPMFFSFIPIMTEDYGNAGAWCWIRIRENQKWRSQILRLFEFYLPLWIAFIYNGISMYKVYKFVKQRTQDRKEHNLVNKLKFYPLILIFCWSMGTIDRIFNFAGQSYFTFHIFHILLAGLQGFINAMVYGLTKKVRKEIRISLQKYCSFCIKKDILTLKDKYEEEQNESEQNQQAIELAAEKQKQMQKFSIE